MKRRVLSFMIALALCLNLCPMWALAAGEGTDGGLCRHHPEHTDECGYVLESPDALCTFACQICPVEDLIGKLPGSVSEENSGQVQAQLTEIYALYDGLTADEQEQVDLSFCNSLRDQLEGIGIVEPNNAPDGPEDPSAADDPAGPEDPGDPSDPNGSEDPSAAGDPDGPEDLGAAGDPDTPEDPGTLGDPDAPADPEEPGDSAVPDDFGDSAVPDAPGDFDTPNESDDSISSKHSYVLKRDSTKTIPFEVSSFMEFDTKGYTYTFTGTGSAAILVKGEGEGENEEKGSLYLTGKVISKNGTGVMVQSGGFLSIADSDTSITAKAYALDIASGAKVRLSAGTYLGTAAAIRTEDGNLAALLERGYAYFDNGGNLLLPADAAKAKIIVVDQCPGHSGKTYTHTPGTTKHTWTCPHCGTVETEACTFTFDQDGNGTCDFCENTLTIAVDEKDLTGLVYDGTMKAEDVSVTVTLADGSGKELVKNADYKVAYQPRADAGEITVTVTGITFNGTFTKTYHVEQDQPGISWDNATCAVDYDSRGIPVDSTSLPHITITIKDPNKEDLHPYLQYFYRKVGDAEFSRGLPINAGEYQIKAYIPESQNYKAAETNPYLTLTINKIPAVTTAPTANTLTYNREAQQLVTAGVLEPGAAAEGAKIEFARAQGGPYSTDIPTGIGVSDYSVYYRVVDTENYSGVSETLITNKNTQYSSARINHREIKPTVELEYYTTLYTGGDKEPVVTAVKDGETVIPKSEYTVAYSDNRNVGTATVTVTNANKGNYKLTTATATFEITAKEQEALSITSQPKTVMYGDQFTLGTQGGSGNGAVTWKITNGDAATVDEHSGQVTVIGLGSVTVQATKSGKDPATGKTNYDDATASWTLEAVKKPVTAIVTADDKVYDSDRSATIHVTWKDGDLVGDDTIDTSELVGTFADETAGANKTVTISGDPVNDEISKKYDITIPHTTASILKADTDAPSITANTLEYEGSAQALVNGGDANTVYSDARDGIYSTNVPTGINAGTYTVWYKELGDANHNESAPQAITVTISRKELNSPNITLSGNDLQTDKTDGHYFYVYDGTEKKPTVTIKDGEVVIPASEYAVDYSNNKNVSTETEKATVTITSNAGGNYTFDKQTVNFEITEATAQLTETPQAKNLTYDGTRQDLVTVGTASGGTVVYTLDKEDQNSYSETIPQGTNAGTYIVYYKVKGDTNHDDTASGQVSVTIKPKEIVSPIVTVTSGPYTYDGNAKELTVNDVKVEDGGTTIPVSEYTVSCTDNVNAGIATVRVTNANRGNYIVNGTGTFIIGKADAKVEGVPKGNENLPYNGTAQALATAGKASGGTMVYSLSETGDYSPVIPAQTAVDTYTVWYKVQGDGNHEDTAPASVTASIIKNTVTTPTIQVTPEAATYTGKKQDLTVTIKDNNGVEINGSEYTVTYADADNEDNDDLTQVGTYNLTITATGGNYDFSGNTVTATFKILPADQTPLTITNTRERVYYGDKILLGTSGGSGNGTITWEVENPGGSTIASIVNGLLTIEGVGSVTVKATRSAPGYADQTATWSFFAEKKPVTAVVTAESRVYNSKKDSTVTAALQSSDLVNGDEKVTITLEGSFEDANAGTNKKVTVYSTSPGFPEGKENIYENYSITYPATTTASIFKADVDTEKVTVPEGKTDLKYTGLAQPLVTPGSSPEGTLEYSTDNIVYSAGLPTGTDAHSYDVWYRVKGDGNHNDTAGINLGTQVTIAQQEVKDPIIEFKPTGASYDGAVHKPGVTVKDNNGRTIPDSEYTVDYGDTDWTRAGDHKVTVTNEDGGNYIITKKDATFKILMMGQNPLTITNQPGTVHYGDSFTLSTTGGSGTGTIKWEVTDGIGIAEIQQSGFVKVTDSGSVTITATKQADSNYGSTTATWTFSAEKKPVKAIVTAEDRAYVSGNTNATIHVTWKDGDLLGGDTITLNLTGTFDSPDVGNNKTVKINGTVSSGGDKYAITWNGTTTASITPAAAGVTAPTQIENGLAYTGNPQNLVNAGGATNGTIQYSLDGIVYGPNVPTGTNAGPYTVWYKVTGDENYKDVAPAVLPVTIAPKTVNAPVIELSPETFTYDGNPKKPDVVVKDGNIVIPASEYTVGYGNNVQVSTEASKAEVTISNAPGGNYIVGDKTAEFTITAGNAVLTVIPRAQDLTYDTTAQELVTEGVATNGKVVYLDPETNQYSDQIPKATDAGTYKVYYKVQSDNGTSDTAERSVFVTIKPKTVANPIIELDLDEDFVEYNGSAHKPRVLAVMDGRTRIPASEYEVRYKNVTSVGTATVTIISTGGNYDIYASTTFEIVKATAKFAQEPTGKAGLVYNNTAQELVDPGTAEGGIIFYSLDGVSYSGKIPTGTERKPYTVYAKVVGDSTHADSDVITIPVEIGTNTIEADELDVILSSTSVTFTGYEQKPTVTVRDKDRHIIPASEYETTYDNNIEVGKASVTVESTGSNYSFKKEVFFQITAADKPALKITGQKDTVYYGDTLRLGTTGGSGDVTWTVEAGGESVNPLDGGRFEIIGSGSITIKAATSDSSDTWQFYADPKPVTAIVTAEDKTYNGNTDATFKVTVSGLVPNDSVDGVTASGYFKDANAGANKIVVISGLNIPEGISTKYTINCPDNTTTATITPAPASVREAPKKKDGLTYTGQPQPLIIEGEAENGNMAYSLDGVKYDFIVPTGTDAKPYTVWYKAVATDENHKDSAPVRVTGVAIDAKTVETPTVLCTSIQYDGKAKTPTFVVQDDNHRIIPEGEYTYTVSDASGKLVTSATEVGTYTVTVTDRQNNGNYEFDMVTGTFEIIAVNQNPLSIVTDIPNNVHYGDNFRLSAIGGSGSGAIKWSIEEENAPATINPSSGVVEVTGTGGFTVQAYREASDGYSKSNTAIVAFEAKPKPVTAIARAVSRGYNTEKTTDVTVTVPEINNIITFTVTGTFADENVGANKTVTIAYDTDTVNGINNAYPNYQINWPDTTTASIDKVDAKIDNAPRPRDLTYETEADGSPKAQPLVTGGSTVGGIGKIVYSTSQNGTYSENIPTGTEVGRYSVWYKVPDSVNYTGIPAAEVKVEIVAAQVTVNSAPTGSGTEGEVLGDIPLNGGAADVPGEFSWMDSSIKPINGNSYEAVFTPNDTANYNPVTIPVTVTMQQASSSNNTGSTPAQTTTTVQGGTASTVVSAADGSKLVQGAKASQSRNAVIRPEITGNVTKTEVSIPASTVSQLGRETDAALTVSSSVADVTIPNAALSTLSSGGGTVNVVTEQTEQGVALEVAAGGKIVEQVPGGLTLAVSVEDAGPGTVAVLVHDDGTRETVRKSVVGDGVMSIPLSGSATVEIVNNSKDFADVPQEDWAADAVDFASSHELFSGTSETTFSPDLAMSRGMLATVLYRLEGNPELKLTDLFLDVSSDAWYAEGVAWAAENGIAGGYGDGQFGPDDDVTREQFVVMLWRYAGSPEAGSQALDFVDADQVSSFALEALCWAVENDILHGVGNGMLDPGGTATRAQAAQLLKNFVSVNFSSGYPK